MIKTEIQQKSYVLSPESQGKKEKSLRWTVKESSELP
jgi:hypothetical protein